MYPHSIYSRPYLSFIAHTRPHYKPALSKPWHFCQLLTALSVYSQIESLSEDTWHHITAADSASASFELSPTEVCLYCCL